MIQHWFHCFCFCSWQGLVQLESDHYCQPVAIFLTQTLTLLFLNTPHASPWQPWTCGFHLFILLPLSAMLVQNAFGQSYSAHPLALIFLFPHWCKCKVKKDKVMDSLFVNCIQRTNPSSGEMVCVVSVLLNPPFYLTGGCWPPRPCRTPTIYWRVGIYGISQRKERL